MTTNVKLTTVGNSAGIVLPKEVLERLHVGTGDVLRIVETPNGVELSRYDPEFEAQMDIADDVMREDSEVLKRLAE